MLQTLLRELAVEGKAQQKKAALETGPLFVFSSGWRFDQLF
jgi:hypothetical protein